MGHWAQFSTTPERQDTGPSFPFHQKDRTLGQVFLLTWKTGHRVPPCDLGEEGEGYCSNKDSNLQPLDAEYSVLPTLTPAPFRAKLEKWKQTRTCAFCDMSVWLCAASELWSDKNVPGACGYLRVHHDSRQQGGRPQGCHCSLQCCPWVSAWERVRAIGERLWHIYGVQSWWFGRILHVDGFVVGWWCYSVLQVGDFYSNWHVVSWLDSIVLQVGGSTACCRFTAL